MKKCLVIGVVLTALWSCQSDDAPAYTATPMPLDIPAFFASSILPPVIPLDNPQSVEGVALGKKLFYDPILSANGTQACADCHLPSNSFTDNRQYSIGSEGDVGTRNSMPLFNIAWNFEQRFFWDGAEATLENQIFEPVVNPTEMNNTWRNVTESLDASPIYPELFSAAFGTTKIDSVGVSKAIAQFLRTLISSNAKFDRHLTDQVPLTPEEQRGLAIFLDESRGDCFHCHGNPNTPLWTDNRFHNNGLDEFFTDRGLGAVTGDPRDDGLFKTPSLRNLAFTAPYMHDGRFNTLEEVIDHYSEGLVYSETISPLMKNVATGGVHLSPEEKSDLKAFLLSLSDQSFIENPVFQNN
ncbi:MAG: cytochrome c peroxidase [Flavobacteriaceae bacterium]|nr:cytochrome c peroxidase [Flavobacteriaceae bacterium]MDG1962782.1 cytochrome c peroxidase [Flavobacteriaceae bacterium]